MPDPDPDPESESADRTPPTEPSATARNELPALLVLLLASAVLLALSIGCAALWLYN